MYLQDVFGKEASFRDGQQEAIKLIMNKKRVLVVQKTGWGKSLVYFLATKMLRENNEGVTLIISPLLALTRNQLQSVDKYGIKADCINSTFNKTKEERARLIERCNNGDCDVLFITPEQLENVEFVNLLAQLRVGLFVVDEAHCISDWGHDFRPDYRRINQLIKILPENIAILATTATANERVIGDICKQLGDCEVVRGPLKRDSLYLHKIYMPNGESKYAWMAKNIPFFPGSGIIYGTTIKECEKIASWLRENGIKAEAYHSQLDESKKLLFEDQLEHNKLKVLVATISLGMGYDKKDISFVIHYYTPKSVIEYYQQIGRAGRSIETALCILLYGGYEEKRINEFFINNSFPKQEHFNIVTSVIEQVDSIKYTELKRKVNVTENTFKQILKLLSLEGIISKDSNGYYYRTTKQYVQQEVLYEEVKNMKRNDFNQLLAYQEYTGCLMDFITKELDDPYTETCGKCSTCLAGNWNWTQDTLTESEIDKVQSYFDKSFNIITPRRRSAMTNRNLGVICEEGLALSYYHEELGQEARKGKYEYSHFSDKLVHASSEKLKRFLNKQKISCERLFIVPIPSYNRPRLVPDFAKKLANNLQINYVEVLEQLPKKSEQKNMLNSILQEENVRDHLNIIPNLQYTLENCHIILIDDFVDSKWTFAVAADLLGTKYNDIKVTPFALSITGNN
ncbi:RecQ family ATP-dependent DNA helicase [Bacillus altitudinis]|uniref:RecQ family ATP-dependent DNA helicase n=1 Tax=Bacillus altitudinis TaxID=293387 RepID=UPI00203B2088|nr:RecQ family ATP-dependent DNA helicase [Bacillus altitudinis]MCM3063856.1 RecQ family ATP-dependent DNA helicase [Bacillus altitudinis]MCM3076940.1 RecQ family ATP-dependent DNA helicase [Bacillus altitudinis]